MEQTIKTAHQFYLEGIEHTLKDLVASGIVDKSFADWYLENKTSDSIKTKEYQLNFISKLDK